MNQKLSKKLINRLIIANILILLFSFFPPTLSTAAPEAELRLSYDDGIQCYLNNVEVVSALDEGHGTKYWNKQVSNLGSYLRVGQNLVACRVSNGDGNSGSGSGGFDLELVVAGQTVIPKSSSDWKVYGESHKTTPPPYGVNNRSWYDINYNDENWRYGTTPLGGGGKDILSNAPDDGWFRKSFNLSSSLFGSTPPSSPTQICPSLTNKTDCLNRGCYWSGYVCQENYLTVNFDLYGCWPPSIHRFGQHSLIPEGIREVFITTAQPLITGLVKYNTQIDVYVDNQLIGKAIVKEGELTGVANFYFKPKGNIVPPQQLLELHTLELTATNLFDKTMCHTEINFRVVPYPAPVIHRLGEIPFIQRADQLTIKTKNPLISGLVKYGSSVDVYVDDRFVGSAKVKEGELTGVANFYLRLPTLAIGDHTLYTIARPTGYKDISSTASQVLSFTIIK